MLHSICQQIWKTQQWPQDWKRSVFIPIPKKGNAKECPNYRTIALISHASKVMLKILQAKLQQYVNHYLPDVQAGSRNYREVSNSPDGSEHRHHEVERWPNECLHERSPNVQPFIWPLQLLYFIYIYIYIHDFIYIYTAWFGEI